MQNTRSFSRQSKSKFSNNRGFSGEKKSISSSSNSRGFEGVHRSFSPTANSNSSFGRYGAPRRPFNSSHSSSNNRSFARPKRNYGDKIDYKRFICKSADKPVAIEIDIKNTFKDFPFCEALHANIQNRNYTAPTPIQDQAINPIIEGRDLIGLANTGTGKTAAFLLPLINKVFLDSTQKVLIIVPTRELALQIEEEFRRFSWGMRIFSAACVGGAPIQKQIQNLKRNPNFVIGTPGRIKDLQTRRFINFGTFNNVVLDEVDRMLDMGFFDEISYVLSQLPKIRQSLFFSATLPVKIKSLVGQFLIDPITIEIKQGETAQNVDQDIVRVTSRDTKFSQLQDLLNEPELKKVLIFIETKVEVEKVTNDLISSGFKAESIHSDKRQSKRQRALGDFKNNIKNILVATDVAARGIDVKDISHVINYTVPQTYNDYIHRIGRTGRGDCKGKALTFVEIR